MKYLLIPLILISMNAVAAVDNSIRVSLEEPVSATPHSGISNLRGWAINDAGIDRIELYIDDKYVADIPYGGIRTDVGNAYPNIQNSDYSGFSMAFNYNLLTAGAHTARARAYNMSGDHRDSSVAFSAAPISDKFLRDPNAVILNSGSEVSANTKDSLEVKHAVVDGKAVDINLKWNPAIQGFSIQKVAASSTVPNYVRNASGIWRAPAFGDRYLIQLYTAQQNDRLFAAGVFLDLQYGSFEAGEGRAVNDSTLVLSIEDEAITADYSITFSSSTQASIYVSSCRPKPAHVCLLKSGDTVNIVKAI